MQTTTAGIDTDPVVDTSTTDLETTDVDFSADLTNVEANILEELGKLEEAGIERDEALQQAIATVADDLGTTEDNLKQAIADSESALAKEISDLATDVATDLSNIETNILEEVEKLEEAGIDRDKALAEAIGTVSSNLGITEAKQTKIIEAGDTALSDEITSLE